MMTKYLGLRTMLTPSIPRANRIHPRICNDTTMKEAYKSLSQLKHTVKVAEKDDAK